MQELARHEIDLEGKASETPSQGWAPETEAASWDSIVQTGDRIAPQLNPD